jgi:ribosomal protein S27AE
VKVECFEDDDRVINETKALQREDEFKFQGPKNDDMQVKRPNYKITTQNKKICPECGDLFPTKEEFKKHLKTHKKTKGKSDNKIPVGFKRCPVCSDGKILKKESFYKHVRSFRKKICLFYFLIS